MTQPTTRWAAPRASTNTQTFSPSSLLPRNPAQASSQWALPPKTSSVETTKRCLPPFPPQVEDTALLPSLTGSQPLRSRKEAGTGRTRMTIFSPSIWITVGVELQNWGGIKQRCLDDLTSDMTTSQWWMMIWTDFLRVDLRTGADSSKCLSLKGQNHSQIWIGAMRLLEKKIKMKRDARSEI